MRYNDEDNQTVLKYTIGKLKKVPKHMQQEKKQSPLLRIIMIFFLFIVAN